MKNKIVSGTLILVISGFICKFLGALFRIPLSEIIGAEGIGLYQMIMPIYSFALVAITGGITTGLSRLVSKARAVGNVKKIHALFKCAVVYTFISGLILSIVFFFIRNPLASLQGNSKASLSYIAIAIAIFFAASESAFRGYFQGYENMFPTAISQIIEQILKLIVGVLLSYLFIPYGLEYGVFGAIMGIAVSEIFSLFFLIIYMHYRKERVNNIDSLAVAGKELFFTTAPLTFGSIVLPLANAIESLAVVPILISLGFSSAFATSLYGVATGMVGSLINMPIIISISLAISLLPAVSYKYAKGDIDGANKDAKDAINWVWMLVLPASVGLVSIAPYVLSLLFPSLVKDGLLSVAVNVLFISSGTIIFSSLMQTTTALLQARGKIVLSVANLAIGGIIKLIFLFIIIFIKDINIYAVAISNLVMSSLVCLVNLYDLRDISFNFKLKELLLPVIGSLIMGVVIYFILKFTHFSNFISCLVAGFVGVIIYFIFVFPILKDYRKKKV